MLFQNSFYTVVAETKEDETHTVSIKLNPSHQIFEGHFPGNPVTPGVVQMEIIKELIGMITSQNIRLKTMGTCKFLAILNPEKDPNIDVIIKLSTNEDGEIKSSTIIKNDSDTFLKMNASYEAC